MVKRLREAADDPSRVLPDGANLFQGLTEKSPVDQHKNVPDLAQPEQLPYAANLFLRRFLLNKLLLQSNPPCSLDCIG